MGAEGMRKLIVVAAALTLLAAASASAKHHHRSACQKLKGTDLAPAKTAKLVERKGKKGTTQLVGCVLPRGKVRVLGVKSPTQDYTLRQVAGHYALIQATLATSLGTDRGTAVADMKTGKSYFVARYLVGDSYNQDSDLGSFLTSHGTAIAAINPTAVDDVEIREFTSKGIEGTLDSGTQEEIPPASLQLNGNIATWVHNGTVHTAAL